MLDAADVLINREPVVRNLRIKWRFVIVRVSVAIEIPGRIHECVHGVGLAPCRPATLRTLRVQKFRHALQRRAAGQGDINLVGENDGQIFLRHGNNSVFLAIHHRNRRSPITLARNAPIFQTVSHCRLAEVVLLGISRHLLDCFFASEPCEFARVDQLAVQGRKRKLFFV